MSAASPSGELKGSHVRCRIIALNEFEERRPERVQPVLLNQLFAILSPSLLHRSLDRAEC